MSELPDLDFDEKANAVLEDESLYQHMTVKDILAELQVAPDGELHFVVTQEVADNIRKSLTNAKAKQNVSLRAAGLPVDKTTLKYKTITEVELPAYTQEDKDNEFILLKVILSTPVTFPIKKIHTPESF